MRDTAIRKSRHVVAAASVCLVALAVPAAPVAAAGRHGDLVASAPATAIDRTYVARLASARTITYRSSVDSRSGRSVRDVTGTVFLPRTAAGKKVPLVVFAHGTSGVETRCAPSQDATLRGSLRTIERLTGAGWAVVATDYRGLGSPGAHPYVDAQQAAYDVLDSAPAAIAAAGGRIDTARVALFGVSQGGQAAARAAELASGYTPAVRYRGAALASPALDLTPLVGEVESGRASAVHRSVLPYVARGVVATQPRVALADLLSGPLLRAARPDATTCTNEQLRFDPAAVPPAQYRPTAAGLAALTAHLTASRVPQKRTTMPVYITRGRSDTLVNTAWSTSAVAAMRAIGDEVTDDLRDGDHTDEADLDDARVISWIRTAIG